MYNIPTYLPLCLILRLCRPWRCNHSNLEDVLKKICPNKSDNKFISKHLNLIILSILWFLNLASNHMKGNVSPIKNEKLLKIFAEKYK